MTLIHSDQGGMQGCGTGPNLPPCNPRHTAAFPAGKADEMIASYGGGGLIEDVFVPEYCTTPGNCAAYGDLVQQSNNRLLRLTAKGYANKTASVRQALADAGLPCVTSPQRSICFYLKRGQPNSHCFASVICLLLIVGRCDDY